MRIKVRVLVTVLVCALVLAVAGAGSWFYLHRLHRDTGPSEPMCLVLTRQDVRPLVGDLAIRVMGEITEEKLETVRESDAILREEIAKIGRAHV